MKTFTLKEPTPELADLFSQARDEELIVRLEDGSEFFLSPVDDFDREIEATRRNERLMAFLEERARQTETIPWNEAKGQIGLDDASEADQTQESN